MNSAPEIVRLRNGAEKLIDSQNFMRQLAPSVLAFASVIHQQGYYILGGRRSVNEDSNSRTKKLCFSLLLSRLTWAGTGADTDIKMYLTNGQ